MPSSGIATFSIGGNDISQYVGTPSINIERDIKTFKPIGGNPAVQSVGAYSGTISLEGVYETALDAIMAPLMLAATPATSAFIYRPAGSGGGTRSFTGVAYVASYRVDSPGDDIATWRAELAISGTITNA